MMRSRHEKRRVAFMIFSSVMARSAFHHSMNYRAVTVRAGGPNDDEEDMDLPV